MLPLDQEKHSEYRKKLSDKAKLRCGKLNPMFGRTHSEQSRNIISVKLTGRPGPIHSEATRKKLSDQRKGLKFSDEHRQKISEAAKRRTGAKNGMFGKVPSEETRRKIGQANRHNLKAIFSRDRKLKRFSSQLELFLKDKLFRSGKHFFKHQGHIPNFYKFAGRTHAWDFLLPDKKIAIEIDGKYWHSCDNPGWDPIREYENEFYALLLGWRVIRIPEMIVRKSKEFKLWLLKYNQSKEN